MPEKPYKPPSFNIIHHRGKPNEARLPDGTMVFRRDRIYVPEQQALIKCPEYDEHFIYEVPMKFKNVPSFMCTCGSAAVIAGVSSYGHLGESPQGKIFVCLMHSTTGHHSNTSTWI